MSNLNSSDSMAASLLKKCYDLAAVYERSEAAGDILREKSAKIDLTGREIPVQEDTSHRKTEMQIISEVIYALSTGKGTAGSADLPVQTDAFRNLPASAEKEYVLALLALRNGTDERHRIEAMRHLGAACSVSPHDPRFLALADVLMSADR